MVTIVFAHPWHGSFNKAILDTITRKLDRENKPYEVIDLNKDNFNPVFTEQELSTYSLGKPLDPLVTKYQDIIRKTDDIILVFPNWWSSMPAILKGFFDKVLLKDFAFNYEGGFNPLLKINRSTVITTSDNPSPFFEDYIHNGLIANMLNPIGVNNVVWLGCKGTAKGSNENRIEFLKQVEERV